MNMRYPAAHELITKETSKLAPFRIADDADLDD